MSGCGTLEPKICRKYFGVFLEAECLCLSLIGKFQANRRSSKTATEEETKKPRETVANIQQ